MAARGKGKKAPKEVPKRRKQSKKSSDVKEVDADDPETKAKGNIDWDDEDLNWALISAITDNPEIKQGLFPPPGANVSTKNGSSKPKTEHQWALCVALFTSHPAYRPAFALIKTAKDKERWVHKIKNRLKNMTTKTHEYMEEMGQTGASIEQEADINTDTPNVFTTKWAQIKSVWPWYFEMRELIGQCPNVILTGLSNSELAFDNSVLLNKHEREFNDHNNVDPPLSADGDATR